MAIVNQRFLFLFIVLLSYSQAVVELNTDSIRNTWDDEYDSYIHTKDVEIQKVNTSDHPTDFESSGALATFQISPVTNSLPDLRYAEVNLLPSKLFLKNCSFLI